jgi:hypothetical protein
MVFVPSLEFGLLECWLIGVLLAPVGASVPLLLKKDAAFKRRWLPRCVVGALVALAFTGTSIVVARASFDVLVWSFGACTFAFIYTGYQFARWTRFCDGCDRAYLDPRDRECPRCCSALDSPGAPLHLRFSIRNIMIAIVILAMMVAGWREIATLALRSKRYEERALTYSQGETEERIFLSSHESSVLSLQQRVLEWDRQPDRTKEANWPEDSSSAAMTKAAHTELDARRRMLDARRARLAYFARMKQKYETAARRPWCPLAPDQPEPPRPQ